MRAREGKVRQTLLNRFENFKKRITISKINEVKWNNFTHIIFPNILSQNNLKTVIAETHGFHVNTYKHFRHFQSFCNKLYQRVIQLAP